MSEEDKSPNYSPVRSVENERDERDRRDEDDYPKHNDINNNANNSSYIPGAIDPKTSDARSIFVGNVDYMASVEELQNHFADCGTINRITILTDKWTGRPKGFAFVEFAEEESVGKALQMNDSVFRDREIKVTTKRTNMGGPPPQRRPPRGPPGGYQPYPYAPPMSRRPYGMPPRRRRPNNYYYPY